jgi:hypothetical protein
VLLVGGEGELLAVFSEVEVRFSLQLSSVRANALNATAVTTHKRRKARGVGVLLLGRISLVLQLRLLRLLASRTRCSQDSALQPAGASRTMYTSSSLQPSNVAAQNWSSSECWCLSISRAQYPLSIVHVWMLLKPICEYRPRASREEHRMVGICSRSLSVVTAESSDLPMPRRWAWGEIMR